MMSDLLRRANRWLRARPPLLTAAYALLAAWTVGIFVAAAQLDGWREDLSRTLLQLNADARFRARAHNREAVDPEWYRRKALALLSAMERLQHDAAWTAFLPGSWKPFDNLEEQVQARLEGEFGDIVVETLRRELYARASKLTGVPLVSGSGDLQMGAECQSPVPQNLERRLSGAAEDLPEFVAVADYVGNVEHLDAAVQSFLSLQYSNGQPEQLRSLVAYALGKELPGGLQGAVRMFQGIRGNDEVDVQPALMQSRLQWASRCSLAKAMGALHTRLLNTNDLFALEQGYVERSNGLFAGPARPAAFDRTLERYRAVHALLEDQNALLSKGRNDWMRQGTLQLGSAYQSLLGRISRTRLLGPESVQQLEGQSGAAFAEFRRQFALAFGSQGEPGIVWLDGEQRFGLSAERAALLQGLGALLKTSFMSDTTTPTAGKPAPATAGKDPRDAGTLPKVLQDARGLATERAQAQEDIVPLFPPRAQPVVARVIDARVSELIYQRAFRTLKAGLPADAHDPLDAASFRQQRDQVLALQVVLKETGGAAFGERLVATLDGELVRRLANLQDDWKQQPLQDARASDFAWWQGEPLALAQMLGAADPGSATPPSFGRTATHLDLLVQQAKPLLALGSPALAADPAAVRWVQLQSELARYTTHASDSSLLRLERYVGALGPDFRRENCAERLAANAPGPDGEDQIAQRHREVHQALAQRCQELRAQSAAATAATTVTQ
jgi:type VI secretion system protein ImpL